MRRDVQPSRPRRDRDVRFFQTLETQTRPRRSNFKTETRLDVPKHVSRLPRERDVQDRDYIPAHHYQQQLSVIVPDESSAAAFYDITTASFAVSSQQLRSICAPHTSVASGQLFSSAGQLYAHRRSSLHGDNAQKLLFFLSYNMFLFGFNN